MTSARQNPLGPFGIATCVSEAFQSLQLSGSLRLMLYRSLESVLGESLIELYASCDKVLAKAQPAGFRDDFHPATPSHASSFLEAVPQRRERARPPTPTASDAEVFDNLVGLVRSARQSPAADALQLLQHRDGHQPEEQYGGGGVE